MGPSNLDELYDGLNRKDFAFIDQLRARGRDLILLGYDERSASILHNARTMQHCIMRAIAERLGSTPLMVGGFSMGGLISRYALARMEYDGMDHQTSTFLTFDSPHRGAWIPIALQALSHFMISVPKLSEQINSPAARQLLWRHIETVQDTPKEDPMRTEFLAELARVGNWPMLPRKLAVANGRGDGQGNGVPPGEKALECTSGIFHPTTLRTQSPSNQVIVALLEGVLQREEVRAVRGMPELDGAAGGTLESYGIAADNLTIPLLSKAVAYHPSVCFVPTISAISGADITTENLQKKANDMMEESDFDDFICASSNTGHSQMTQELGEWILERLPH